MHRHTLNRTASTLITLFGSVTNTILTIQVLAAWRSFKWEPESEWDSSPDNWQLNGIKFIWSLLAIYFASAAAVCIVGLHGVIKNKPTHIRLYRDYSIADLSFCALATAVATYGAFLGPARAGICEELSHHPELMRDMLEMGLNIENCERWLERAVFAALAFMIVILFVRLHFLLAISNYYSHLSKYQDQAYGLYPYNYVPYYPPLHQQRSLSLPPTPAPLLNSQQSSQLPLVPTTLVPMQPIPTNGYPMHRVYLVPNPPSQVTNLEYAAVPDDAADEIVYAPVRRKDLPKDVRDGFVEAWIAGSAPHPNTSSSNSSTTPRNSCDAAPARHRRTAHASQVPLNSQPEPRRSSSRSSRRSHRTYRRTDETGLELELGAGQGRTGLIKLEIAPGEGLIRDGETAQQHPATSSEGGLPGYWDVPGSEGKR
ncbi:hypothetical protein CVT24_011877 [Panaeolus cyanescens]|uniref:Uncharacterized protein n=1 Tax=Panaeolus cyanescens TaxID=181874 RepID=A0A409YNL0_9AGAR|nr:hypothetical protein CVT24_011877 [Panaeolus cyanescens]